MALVETGRLPAVSSTTIRRLTSGDEDEFTARARASIELHSPWIIAPTTHDQFVRYLDRFRTEPGEAWLVRGGPQRDLAGFINLNEIVRGPYQRGLLGYGAFVPLHGRGYMREGMRQIVEHCFGELDLHRLEADIQPDNVRSIELVRAVGFTKEGVSDDFICINGQWKTHERWALVRR
jgi:ribosomal-protein-alanine N-acetyltransferase